MATLLDSAIYSEDTLFRDLRNILVLGELGKEAQNKMRTSNMNNYFAYWKLNFFKLTQFAIIKRLMRDITYLAISYRKRVHNYLGISEGSILNVLLLDVFVILINYLRLRDGFLAEVGGPNKCWRTKSCWLYWVCK